MKVHERVDSMVELLLESLGEAAADVDVRRMFGASGLWADGGMFAIAHEGRLYFKVAPGEERAYEERGSDRFRPYADRERARRCGRCRRRCSTTPTSSPRGRRARCAQRRAR